MVKRGIDSVYLILFSIFLILSFSNFVNAACNPDWLHCDYLSNQFNCDNTYGTYCYWEADSCYSKTNWCSNIAEQFLCTSAVGCTWSSCLPSQSTYECRLGDVWWFDACENPTSIKTDCSSSQICVGDACVSNIPSGNCVGTLNCGYMDDYSCGNFYPVCIVSDSYCVNAAGKTCADLTDAQCYSVGCWIQSCIPNCVGKNCGSDGCGGTCGTCSTGYTCNSGVCTPDCIPTTCAAQSKNCGTISNGCGGTLNCGTCSTGYICTNNVCTCTPTTCAAQSKNCGTISNGCGGTLNCGTCSTGFSCVNNVCSCTATSYTPALNTFCGSRTVVDNCGVSSTKTGTLTCTYPQTCINNVCSCTPTKTTCSSSECGMVPNGCGAYIDCDGCSTGTCIGNTCTCTSTSNTLCSGGDVWSLDSCGNIDEKVEECDKGGGSCYTYNCQNGACTSNYICQCSSSNDCDDGKLCTIDSCSGGNCVYTDRACGVDNDGCCQPGCTYPNDQDCPPPVADCPDGSINQAWEECDCGTDGVCTSTELDGETCSSIDSKYTGGVLGCSFCQFITTSCTLPCTLTDAYWSTTSTYVGNQVSLIVTGSSSCNGKTINFEVWRDALIDTRVTTLSGRTMSSGSVTTTWTPTETSPNNGYYFVAEVSDGSDDIESDRLDVLENTGCWDGTCDESAGENCATCPDDCGSCCGNGNCDSNECVTCPGDCTNCDIPCGDEYCDETAGEDCYNCPYDCNVCASPDCGDGNLDSGEECDDGNTVSGDGCSAYCDVEENSEEEECQISSLQWNESYVLEGTPVKLNFQATNCNSKTISFFVLEKDGGLLNGDDNVQIEPSPIVYNSPYTYGTWIAEGQDDDDSDGGQTYPPEYYFKIIIDDEEKAESSNDGADDPLLLKVGSEQITCPGINSCANYDNQQDCENDICTVGEESAGGLILCGSVYNPVTDCWDNVNCGCLWDSESEICQVNWETESICGELEDICEPYVDECWLAGDLCTDECECFGTSIPNGYGSCDYNAIGVCDESDECWLAGDLCTDECECFGTTLPDGYGACFDDPNAVCVEDYNVNDCWLAGDLCTDECICESGYEANGDGTCGDYNPNVCVPYEDECWLMGDACQNDCTCFGTSIPDGYGACVDDPFAVCVSYVNECWLAGDLCTDECECFGTSTPNAYGSCDYDAIGVCVEDYDVNECWLAGDRCEDDCTCESGYVPNEEGACFSDGSEGGGIIRKKGSCSYAETGDDDCNDNYLDRILDAIWQWDSTNVYTEIPSSEDQSSFIMDVESGVYRYDPQRQSLLCVDVQDRFACPASVEVPFFGVYQLAIVIAIVGLIYLVYALKKKSHYKNQSTKKRKIKRKK